MTMSKKDNDCNTETFVRITNQHIFDKLCIVEEKVNYTNGTVKSHTKLIWALCSTIIIVVGWLIQSIL